MLFMNKLLKIFLLLILTPLLFSFVSELVSTDSHIQFKIKNAGLTVEGKFEKFTTDIKYFKSNPEKSTFNGVIEVSSINTGITMRDNDLQKSGYFDAKKYPHIIFKSTEVKRTRPNVLEITGNLTIKATTKKVVLQVQVVESGSKTTFLTNFDLNRRYYGVGGNSWILSDELKVDLKIIQ